MSPLQLMQQQQEKVEEIQQCEEFLNAWESSFIDSIQGKLKNSYPLSEAQASKLDEIYSHIQERFE